MLDRNDRDQLLSVATSAAHHVCAAAGPERVAAATEYYRALLTEIAERQYRHGEASAQVQLSIAALDARVA